MNTQNKPQVELLAPAGNLSCALAAFDAGADAVYCGLKNFNARERTENFTVEEMDKLIGYAGKHGKKVFVTLNTLIKEPELPALGETLRDLEKLRPDALIVQDLGVCRAIREFFPDLRIHASTQMGLHNSAGLRFARELGIKRVILERQTTIGELEKMMASRPETEVEVFVHGALCCCISGSCLLSSWLGGWSGNRGKCKQPCRRRYHSATGSGFFFSAQDLCTLELLPRIVRTGVASLKIEGRLRRADYVDYTVRAYRLALDSALGSEEEFREVLPKAKELLGHTCGRKWSLGYYTADSARALVKHDSLGASGLLCGKVLSTSQNGFTMSVLRRIHLGDVIRVQPRSGDEGPMISVTKMSRNGESVRRVLQDETCFIHSDKETQPGSFVYKTGESIPDFTKRIAALPPGKPGVSADLFIDRTRIRINAGGLCWEKTLALAEAGKHPLTEETLRSEFLSAQFDGFEISSLHAKIEGNPFLPASVLKSLRLEFRSFMAQEFCPEKTEEIYETHLKNFLAEINARPEKSIRRGETSVILPRGKRAPSGDMTVVREIKDDPSPHEELLLPFFIPEGELSGVRAALAKFAAKGGKTVRITSLHHLALLRDFPGMRIRTCMPLPICNSLTVRELARLGVSDVQLWIELGKTELEMLAEKSVLPAEIYKFGRPVLLTTRAAIPAQKEITDARGNVFYVEKDGFLTHVTAGKIFSIPKIRGADESLIDLRNADGHEHGEAIFNFECGLQ